MAVSNKLIRDKALELFWDKKEKWTYLLGSTGRVAGEDVKVENYFKYFQYINRISKDFTWEEWLAVHKGKQTADCSNSVLNYLVYGKAYEDPIKAIGCNSCWSSHAPSSWEQVSKDKVQVGCVAWKYGHVGLVVHTNPDIITLDIPGASSLEPATFRLLNITKEYPNYWEGFAKFPKNFVTYDYTEGDTMTITAELTKPVSEYHAGDTLTVKDFNVYVRYPDGHIAKNPVNWGAINLTTNSLTLVEGVNKIRVQYKDCVYQFDVTIPSEYFTVKFSRSDIALLRKVCPNIKVQE